MGMGRELLIQYSNRHKKILRRFIAEAFDKRTPFKALDIGCRYGKDLQWLSEAFPYSTGCGIDIESASIRSARASFKYGNRFHFFLAGAERLPFRDEVFDLVVSSEVIEHTPYVQDFIGEARRVLKKGGHFIITTPSKYSYSGLLGSLIPAPFKRRLRKFVYSLNPGKDEDPHFKEYSPFEMRRLFEESGLRVVRVEGSILRVPIWPLFEKAPFLLTLWKGVDWLVGQLPFGGYLKHNFVMLSLKEGK
jgi:ubiquinone/menaquinone biosynthesis C-methylase UbiE